jgi:hypothetical protein
MRLSPSAEIFTVNTSVPSLILYTFRRLSP